MTTNNYEATIVIDQHQGILRIRINRPEKKNALTLDMYRRMGDALREAERDKRVRVVLIQGSEACFSSGNDLNDFMQAPPQDESSPALQFLAALSQAPKPIVAAVHGPAVGIGTTLLLHCDLVYAAEDAAFQLPFINLGLCPEAGSSYLLPRLAGHQRASELLLLGEPFSAESAREIGLVNRIFPKARLHAKVWEIAQKLAAKPPESIRLTKALLRKADSAAIAETMENEARHFLQRLSAPEAGEAISAFLERRAPDFSKFE